MAGDTSSPLRKSDSKHPNGYLTQHVWGGSIQPAASDADNGVTRHCGKAALAERGGRDAYHRTSGRERDGTRDSTRPRMACHFRQQ